MTRTDVNQLRDTFKELHALYVLLDGLVIEVNQNRPNAEQLNAHLTDIRASQERLSLSLLPIAETMKRIVDSKQG
jgi:hypothetical protein